ncbi:MAG TPA: molybdopterin cofactor-binding domain-containing protein [Thermoanaerobaculia bacterium]|nr:molybdopterin cofactor-binding domain-containing protein [Thermoanaerobaculia bacterium]
MSAAAGIDRRRFVELLGGGVVVLVSLRPSELLAQNRDRVYPEDVNAYLRIDPDGKVTVFSGKIEMGQGVMTSQAQMAAEELGVALASVTMVLGDTDQCPWDRGTFGSLTTRMFGPALRAAAAQARAVLVGMAARKLGVPKGKLVVEDGVVSVAGDRSRRVTYGELARGQRISRLIGEKAVLRKVSEFKLMGRSPKRLDGREKVTGQARYAADIRVPGMLHARILRPPAHEAVAAKIDLSAARTLPGVTVVERDDLVAVLHEDREAAARALEAVHAEWKKPDDPRDPENIFDHVVKTSPPPQEQLNRGDLAGARAAAARVFETTYRKGYVAHAPMEPHAALAEVKDGKATVWASTQTPFPTRDRVAEALELDAKNVRVITPYVGGGFGGKSADRQAVEAARLAQITGRPVQVSWTRAEEFFYDTFDPASVVQIVSAIDRDGKITLWDYTVYAAGSRSADLFYDVPNARIRSSGRTVYGKAGAGQSVHPFAVGPWRAPGANMNVFARESQIDVMAAAARADPLEFRLRNTSDARMRKVLQAAADAFGWKRAPGPSGQGRAVACSADAGSDVALMAQVKVDRASGKVKVSRIVVAQDMGTVVNPDGAKMQMEGSVTMGLGYTFAEELRFRGGEILDRNFDSYELPRFSWVPSIETVLVKNDDLAPQGGGEPAIVATGAVMANAVFDAVGARLYRLPMTPDRVKQAIAEGKGAVQRSA